MTRQSTAVHAIFGPTASGKTEVAVELARELGTEVINCDPAQCYAGLPTLTNKPEPHHDAIAPHRLIGVWDLTTNASIHDYGALAHEAIDELVAARGSAVLCGGSGLYHRAALSDMDLPPARENRGTPEQQLKAEQLWDTDQGASAHAELTRLAPTRASGIHQNDRKRLTRALELAWAGTLPDTPGGTIWDLAYRHPTVVTCLETDRADVHAAIEQRTRSMFTQGVVEEVAEIVGSDAAGADTALSETSRKIHGVPIIIEHLRGELTRDEACERLIVTTRQYVRRQDVWARRWNGARFVPAGDKPDRVVEAILDQAGTS